VAELLMSLQIIFLALFSRAKCSSIYFRCEWTFELYHVCALRRPIINYRRFTNFFHRFHFICCSVSRRRRL